MVGLKSPGRGLRLRFAQVFQRFMYVYRLVCVCKGMCIGYAKADTHRDYSKD